MVNKVADLLKQAEERYPRHLTVAVPEVQIRKDALEYFAKLIIQECLGCCESVISDQVPNKFDTWEDGGLQCMAEIRHRFGI